MSINEVIKSRVSIWWWRLKPRPSIFQKDGFAKLVEWCAKGEQNETIYG